MPVNPKQPLVQLPHAPGASAPFTMIKASPRPRANSRRYAHPPDTYTLPNGH